MAEFAGGVVAVSNFDVSIGIGMLGGREELVVLGDTGELPVKVFLTGSLVPVLEDKAD